jgi:transcriptional antiterminator RfaH
LLSRVECGKDGHNMQIHPRYLNETPQWYVVHTHPKQEERAEGNLKAWGVKTFYPKFREPRYNQFTGARTYLIKSLFPKYFFAWFSASEMLHKVCFTRGVHNVVSFGNGPMPVGDEIITIIQSRIDADGFVQLEDEIKIGDRVTIKDGPLRSLIGVFDREIKNSDRVMILLTTLSYQGCVLIEKDRVVKTAE